VRGGYNHIASRRYKARTQLEVMTPVDRYELAAQGADNGLWDWDLTTSRVHYSPGWLAMLGCAESECGSTLEEWLKRIHPEDLETVQQEITAHLEKGSTQFEIQHRMIHQDGCCRWMSCKGVITRDDAGKALRIAACHVDITAKVVVDPLTGLSNRLLLLDHLTRCIEKAKKQEDFLYAVLIVDLNLPESGINSPEPSSGNSLVIAAARRLETALRSKDRFSRKRRADLLARSEGDEFIVLLEGLSELGEAKKVAERLLNEILTPFTFNGREISLPASIGLALSATGYRDAVEALRDADSALYRANSLGRFRYEVFDTAILDSIQARHQLEVDLHGALVRNEFMVFYQPIVSLSSNQIVGFEALARWKHPSRGMVSPLEFIPVAEKTGLIASLDRWVLQEACRQLKAWRENPRLSKDLWISVNLSGTELKQPSLAKEIHDVLLACDLDATGLMLELTEGVVMENPEATQSLLMQLRVMGARIGLDDFGTGYSSLAHLRRFPLDYLKIDCLFVRSLENISDAQKIIRTIKALANQLGLLVIAEGIENSSQLDLIRSLGCEYGQGFLFSKAVSSEQAESLLLDGFESRTEACIPTSSPEKSGVETSSPLHTSSVLPVPDPSDGSPKKLVFAPKRKYVFIGLTALILLFMGGLLARLNYLTDPPSAYTSPPNVYTPPPKPPAAFEYPGKLVEQPAVSEMPAAQEKQKVPAVVRKVAKAKSPPAASEDLGKSVEQPAVSEMPAAQEKQDVPALVPFVEPLVVPVVEPEAAIATSPPALYTYPVEHDHRLGSCKGILTITRETVSYISATAKDNFALKMSQCLFSLENNQLTIKAGSKTFHFKPATALTKSENQSHLSGILENISKFK
jgi:diguanylate cyclase (GGDEF)-like protein/PAS domain S-box-containing protein